MYFYIFIVLIGSKFLVETSTNKLYIFATPERPLISLFIKKKSKITVYIAFL